MPTTTTQAAPAKLDTAIKIACVTLAVGGTLWALLPIHHSPGAGLRPVSSRSKNMPDFALPALDGHTWKLSQHRGDVVLVNFWATWCPPCRAEIPGLIELSRDLSGQPFTIAGIAMDDGGAADVRPFVRSRGIGYPVLLPNASFALSDAVESLPTSFLVDKRGRIAKVYVGEIEMSALRADVRALLNEPAS